MNSSKPAEPAVEQERPISLAQLPSVDVCLTAAATDAELGALSREYLKNLIRLALAELRNRGSDDEETKGATRSELIDATLENARAILKKDGPKLRPVVNATGIVLHTNLGRALLAESAIAAMVSAARCAVNVEFSLDTGARGDRDQLVEEELCELTGAEAATVVNNNAAAVLLTLNSLAEGREVIVSRGELIEIGGSFRIPDVMERAGARLREVGTTNRTHLTDYAAAIGPDAALLMKVHPSNYKIVGFTATVELAELVELGRSRNLIVVEDLGAGALIDLSVFGLPREPIVRERIAAGAGIVTFSGDKLLGGPQAGIIVGQRSLIARLKLNPFWRALRCDKLRLAALEATLRLYRRSSELTRELPTLRLLTRSLAEIEIIAQQSRVILQQRLGPRFSVQVIRSRTQIGSGAQPGEELESRAVVVAHPEVSPQRIADHFRHENIIGRIADDAFTLDLRTIDDPALLAVRALIPG